MSLLRGAWYDSARASGGELSNVIDVAVIGGGGSGLLAGIAAAQAGAQTVVFERMKTPARKVAISGGGRCNFTNTLDARKFVRLFGDKNASQLGHALRAFSKDDLIALLARYGIEGQVERDYRLYTKSGRGVDVVNALAAELQKAGGTLKTSARIVNLARNAESGGFTLEARINDVDQVFRARSVVVCTGGLSYPVTGSTGDGYDWARRFGHQVTALRPALVGLSVEETWPRQLQGLAWPDASVSLWPAESNAAAQPAGTAAPRPAQGKPLTTERAEILFTHFGISGPAILDVSNVFVGQGLQRALLTIDYFPDLRREQLDERILERARQFPQRTLSRALEAMMPVRLLEFLEASLGEDGKLAMCRLPKTARNATLDRLKRTTLTITNTRGMEYGEVTAGGVAWEQIDAATLQSRITPGLFFAGEILDIAGRCGGFNLQAAFSTGYLAGQSAAQRNVELRTPNVEHGS